MSFEDFAEVNIDYEDGTFTIIRNSGATQTYNIEDEIDLIATILEHKEEVDVYEVETSQEQLEREIKAEYAEKFEGDFDDWSW